MNSHQTEERVSLMLLEYVTAINIHKLRGPQGSLSYGGPFEDELGKLSPGDLWGVAWRLWWGKISSLEKGAQAEIFWRNLS